jgi:hypothetical protein
MPGTPLFATSGVLARDPGMPIPAAPATVHAVASIPPAGALPAEGRRVLAEVRRTSGPSAARPEAYYGYESMRLVLDAIRAGGADRARVTRAALRMRPPPASVRFALHTLREGRFEFDRMVE